MSGTTGVHTILGQIAGVQYVYVQMPGTHVDIKRRSS